MVANARLASTLGPDDLNVDGRRQAEIQNLADDIGGEEIERDARKFARQPLAQLADVFVGGAMLRLQVDQNVGVHGSDRRRGAVRHVDGAVRQADIIDDAGDFLRRNDALDGGLDQIAQARGLLDARAGLGAEVQIELAGVGGREEILAEPGNQQKNGRADGQKTPGTKSTRRADAGGQHAADRLGRDRFEATFESALETRRQIPGRRARRRMMLSAA